jgi:hypothetical protein
MKNLENFNSFNNLNEAAVGGTWQSDLEAQPAMIITALYKANNPSESMKKQASSIQGIINSLGLFPSGEDASKGEARIMQILRKMELTDKEIDSMPEETGKQKGLKSISMVAQEAFSDATKTINKANKIMSRAYSVIDSE